MRHFQLCLFTVFALVAGNLPALAEIPYRYSVQEGFIIAIDDASTRGVPHDDPMAWAALNAFATLLESDRYRIPVEYGRTLAWHQGERLVTGMSREEHRRLYRAARGQDASRQVPATILFLRLSVRDRDDGALTVSAFVDLIDVTRGESLARYNAEPVQVTVDSDCMSHPACKSEQVTDILAPFFKSTGDALLQRLGPAPPRGYGEVPPPWLIDPIRYRILFDAMPEDIRAEVVDAMRVEFPYYLSSRTEGEREDRILISYETIAPSWWLADRLRAVFEDLNFNAQIDPIPGGLRISPAT